MKRVFVVVVLAFFITSCGGGSGPGDPGITITGGNWSFESPFLNTTDAQLMIFGGSLNQSGRSLTGRMIVAFSDCDDAVGALVLSGEVRGNEFTLKTSSVNGQVVTVTGTITDPKTVTGAYSVAGGCADGAHGQIAGTYVPPLTGTWKATEDVNGSPMTITLKLTQSTTVTSEGLFPISGTVEYAGSSCAISGTTEPNISFVTGGLVAVMVNTSEVGGGTGQVLYGGFLDNPAMANSFSGFEEVVTGGCTSSGQLITFTKQ